ncbi:MAG: anaerobic ribonucleoside-triphosphate reductase activating protein [Epsilonproteobacteria bacterium]|nr:anaerobic ribonucleoside-triphosphate reductase activating protein [Campylobacterota bacterium]
MWKNQKLFESLTPFTLLDFEGYPSAILWFCGCNMRCEYCYNPEIVLGNGKLSFDDFQVFFKSRVSLLKGVVLCGGEPTLHPEIENIVIELKKYGYKIKLDTNGTNPKVVKKLIENNLIDYIALDYKAPHDKFEIVTKSKKWNPFLETLQLLVDSSLKYEVRTTFYGGLLEILDIEMICDSLKSIGFNKKYYLQNALCDTHTLGNIVDVNNKLSSKDLKVFEKYPFQVILR